MQVKVSLNLGLSMYYLAIMLFILSGRILFLLNHTNQSRSIQDVELGLCMSFKYESGEFVQVIHTTENHWITLSTIGIEKKSCIQVYDSVYNCLPTMAKAQIVNIMWSQQSAIEVCFMDVQMQVNV